MQAYAFINLLNLIEEGDLLMHEKRPTNARKETHSFMKKALYASKRGLLLHAPRCTHACIRIHKYARATDGQAFYVLVDEAFSY